MAAVPVSTVMVDAVHAELRKLGVPETSLAAVQALVLARHLDASTGAASASLSRLLTEVIAEVRDLAGRRPATADDLEARRWRHRPRGSSDE